MMMKIFPCAFIFAIFVSACASQPLPTSPPSPTRIGALPSPTAAKPVQPGSGIAVQNLKQDKQPSGEIKATASVGTQQNLGLGEIELAYPETMQVGETRTIRLRLAPSTQLVSSKKDPAPAKTPNAPDFIYKFSGNIDLYPAMLAELRAVTFDVNPTGRAQRSVETSAPVSWDWLVRAKEAGRQDLSLEISIPGIVNGVPSDLSTRVLQDLPIVVQVQAVPDDPFKRIMDSIANNAGAIAVALIGLIGTIIGIIVKRRVDQAETAREFPEE